jgi:hypothetical protein
LPATQADGTPCVTLALERGEPLEGTAPKEAAFLLVEQQKPWGRDALRESDFDRDVAQELAAAAAAAAVRIQVVRRPRRTRHEPRAFLAWTGPQPFVRVLERVAPRALLDLDLEALARGEEPGPGAAYDRPLFLVCTNGRRDPCCAPRGTAAVRALRDVFPDETWECSHLGGHRFAATMLALPSGACFGRLTPDDAVRAATEAAAGRLVVDHLRGIVGRDPAVQAAEVLLRRAERIDGTGDLEQVEAVPDGAGVVVAFTTRDGRRLSIRVVQQDLGEGPLSCGGKPEPITAWQAPP